MHAELEIDPDPYNFLCALQFFHVGLLLNPVESWVGV